MCMNMNFSSTRRTPRVNLLPSEHYNVHTYITYTCIRIHLHETYHRIENGHTYAYGLNTIYSLYFLQEEQYIFIHTMCT